MVLDASVWVAALIKKEQHHAESALFLSRLLQDRRTASVPILVLAEVAGAIARQLGTALVTWDNELLERAAALVPTFTPADWLRQNPCGRS